MPDRLDQVIEFLDAACGEFIEQVETDDSSTTRRLLVAHELMRVQRATLLAALSLSAGEPIQGEEPSEASPTSTSRFAEGEGGVTFR